MIWNLMCNSCRFIRTDNQRWFRQTWFVEATFIILKTLLWDSLGTTGKKTWMTCQTRQESSHDQCCNLLVICFKPLWPIPSLRAMRSTLLHLFYVGCDRSWKSSPQGSTSSLVVGSECFPRVWRYLETNHIAIETTQSP